jgi:cyclopropane fatty-acyl-phospholipid synthase-like methyltransferase
MKSPDNSSRVENGQDRMREIRPFLDKIEVNPQSKVLDVGAGNGMISDYFLGRGMTVTALDYDFPVGVEFDEKI